MNLYKLQNGSVIKIKEKAFELERDLQRLFEKNLEVLMGLELVKSEVSIKNRRIDTLAFDKQSNAFVIIEYKRDRSNSVIDQGFAYLGLMLESKADFLLEYNETLNARLKREDIDWSQTRVVFVSSSFTENQIQATNFKDLAIELWEIKRFENDTLLVKPIKKSPAAASIKPITQKNELMRTVSSEIRVFTEEDHLMQGSDSIRELYSKVKTSILNLSNDVEVVPLKQYIAFKKGKNVADAIIQKKAIKLFINMKVGELDDPKHLATDVSAVGHWGNGHYQVQLVDDRNLEYIMSLVKQSLNGIT